MLKHKISTMRLADLKPAGYNPRTISKEALAGLGASLKRFGLVQPIVWNRRTGNVVGGHQRIKALVAAGEKQANVVEVDLSMKEERALNVTLNNPAISGEFTDDLQGILDEIEKDFPQDFADLRLDELGSLALDSDEIQEDIPPPFPSKAATKRGDFWVLGPHRLFCGDSTKDKDVRNALGATPVDMIFTDPPWNVDIAGGSHDMRSKTYRSGGTIMNDKLGKDFGPFLRSWAKACLPHLQGDLYCVMAAQEWPIIDAILREASMHWSTTIIWVKDVFVFSRRQYHSRFEPIWYGWNSKGKSSFTGQRDQDDVWEIPRPKVSEEHPTMKPVELVARAVNNSSHKGSIVFDPFAGAGSTLMACQQLGRRFVGIEIDPKYCDVIIKRWEKFTDGKAKRI